VFALYDGFDRGAIADDGSIDEENENETAYNIVAAHEAYP
jgi:hypothetical protein